MRNLIHSFSESKTGKSAIFRIEVDDRFGKKIVNFSSVKGWRKELALKYLAFEPREWNDDAARIYVGLQVLKCAKDKYEAVNFISILKLLSNIEVHFWSSKFLMNKRTKKAWRAFYG
jgi:hypothetical protein